MIRIIISLIALFTFLGCQKQTFFFEDKMWKILSDGTGIWEVKKITSQFIHTDGTVEDVSVLEPEDMKFYFYMRSEPVFGTIIENRCMAEVNKMTDGDYLYDYYYINQLNNDAENERITMYNGSQTIVYTIADGGRKKQTWVQIFSPGSTTSKITYEIKKCDFCTPVNLNPDFVESGG